MIEAGVVVVAPKIKLDKVVFVELSGELQRFFRRLGLEIAVRVIGGGEKFGAVRFGHDVISLVVGCWIANEGSDGEVKIGIRRLGDRCRGKCCAAQAAVKSGPVDRLEDRRPAAKISNAELARRKTAGKAGGGCQCDDAAGAQRS